jgi:hypothetical protein
MLTDEGHARSSVFTSRIVDENRAPTERGTQGRSRARTGGQSDCRWPRGLVCSGWKSAQET